jgi:hypothetical protein
VQMRAECERGSHASKHRPQKSAGARRPYRRRPGYMSPDTDGGAVHSRTCPWVISRESMFAVHPVQSVLATSSRIADTPLRVSGVSLIHSTDFLGIVRGISRMAQ